MPETKATMRFTAKVLLAISKPPTNEYLIAADLKVTPQSVARVVSWGLRYGYVEKVEIEGYLPHLILTKDGREYVTSSLKYARAQRPL